MKFFFNEKLLLATILILVNFLAACEGAKEREEKYLKRAENYFNEENYPKAKIEIKNVLQINPKNSQARVLLGKISQQSGNFRQAFQDFKAALDDDPKQIDARLELAKIYLSASKDSEAKQYVEEALALAPTNNEAKALLAGLLMRSGEKDKAITLANEVLANDQKNFQAIAVLAAIYVDTDISMVLQKIDAALEKDTKSEPLKKLKIEILKRIDKYEEADAIYNQLIADHPDNFSYYDKLAASLMARKEYDKAEQVIITAINNNQDSVDPILALVQVTNKVKGSEASIALLNQYIEKKPEFYKLKQTLITYYLENDKLDKAKDVLKNAIAEEKTSANALSARVDLAKIYLREKNVAEAKNEIEQVFIVEKSNTEARILSARIKMSENNFKDATSDLRTAIKNDSQSVEALKLLALIQEKDNTPELALDSYFHILEIDDKDASALFGAARLSIQNNNQDMAKKLLDRLLLINPNFLDANVVMVNLLLSKNELENAERLCQKLINSDPLENKIVGHNLMGKVYSTKKQWTEAKEQHQKAMELSPESYESLSGIVNATLALNKMDEAISLVENYLTKFPTSKRAKQLLANMYYKQKKIDASISLYQELVRDFPEDASFYQSLSTIYLDLKQLDKATSVYEDGLKKYPDSVSLRVFLGNTYTYKKQYELAKEQYELALKQSPSTELIKNNLAILLVNYLPSEANIQKAVSLTSEFSNSKEPNYIDTLGWVQYTAGNIPQAISYLQKAVNMQELPEFRFHLGMAYVKNKQHEDAKRELALAIQNAPESAEWLTEAKKVMAQL